MVNRITDLYDVRVLIVSVLRGSGKEGQIEFKPEEDNSPSIHSLKFGRIVDHRVVVPRPVVQGSGMCLNHALDGDVVVHGDTDELVWDLQHWRNCRGKGELL